jgi:hypothetical protein
MCKKDPEVCKAKIKCKSCKNVSNNTGFGDNFMLNFKSLSDMKLGIPVGELFVLGAGKGSHTIVNFDTEFVIDKEQEHDKIVIDVQEVDKLQIETDSIVIVK